MMYKDCCGDWYDDPDDPQICPGCDGEGYHYFVLDDEVGEREVTRKEWEATPPEEREVRRMCELCDGNGYL